jgi:hypothetical protein
MGLGTLIWEKHTRSAFVLFPSSFIGGPPDKNERHPEHSEGPASSFRPLYGFDTP